MNFSTLPTVDWAIVVAYLAASVAVGLLLGRSDQSAEGYLVGRRSLSWWALLLSIVATETSTVTFLSIPGQTFSDGGNLTFLQIVFGFIVGRLIVVAVLIPLFFSGRFVTAYEVLQQRFGPNVRMLASLTFLVTRNLADGLRLFLTGLLINSATGLDLSTCVIGLAACTALYAAIGGVGSVVVNDCLQFLLYTLGACAALWLLLANAPGGAAGVWEFAESTGRLRLFDFNASLKTGSITFGAGLIGGAALTLATHGVDHLMVQRYLCARSQRSAGWALGLSGPVVGMQFLLFLAIGAALAHLHATTPVDYTVDRPDRAFIGYIVNDMPIGLRGLVVASVLAASMSTLSSSLNASASVFVNDVRRRPAGDSDRRTVSAARIATVGFAIVQVLVAVVAFQIDLKQQVITGVLAIAAFSTGLLVGLYALGMVLGRASETAGWVGFACGLVVCCGVAFGLKIDWPWFALVGAVTTFAVGYPLCFVFPAKSSSA